MASPRVLFVLKKREAVTIPGKGMSNGLANSVRFLVGMLLDAGIACKYVEVIDNNCIHREVVAFNPTHCFIEALWVVPEKFKELHRVCPNVKWIVRGHSEIPFLAQEGIAIDWICRYVQMPNVTFAANSPASARDIRKLVAAANPLWKEDEVQAKVIELSNFYPYYRQLKIRHKKPNQYLDVACFGAVRPLKNQLIQALTAMDVANKLGKTLRFHINGTRPETGGVNVLKNLEAVFLHTKHQLVSHMWMDHDSFLETLGQMDLGMQVSFSETFNIVAADMVVAGLPTIGSTEISWLARWCQAEPTNSADITMVMLQAQDWRFREALRILNLRGLKRYCETSKSKWLRYLRDC